MIVGETSGLLIPAAASGVLPVLVGDPSRPAASTPYTAPMIEVVNRFGFTRRRREILRGFLRHRAAVRAAGVDHGFQWLSGSFVQEGLDREPSDVDVVTFGPGALGPQAFPLFAGARTKSAFDVDSYYLALTEKPTALVGGTVYWYELFTSVKPVGRKGFVCVDVTEDLADCTTRLQEMGE